MYTTSRVPGLPKNGIAWFDTELITFIKVNDNGDGLSDVSNRLEHLLLAIQDNQQHNLIRSDEYTDALTAVSSCVPRFYPIEIMVSNGSCRFVERAQRATQRQLKRSLGDFTWNRDEIAVELKRISNDLNNYLPGHTVSSKYGYSGIIDLYGGFL